MFYQELCFLLLCLEIKFTEALLLDKTAIKAITPKIKKIPVNIFLFIINFIFFLKKIFILIFNKNK